MNGWVNNREAGDLRRYLVHYDVIVMQTLNLVECSANDTAMYMDMYKEATNGCMEIYSMLCLSKRACYTVTDTAGEHG